MKLFENDIEFYSFIDKLIQNKKLLDIARLMKPLDIAHALANDLDLCADDAVKTTITIYEHIFEGIGSTPNIETNKMYPVPAAIRRDNMPKGEEEDPLVKASESDSIEEDAGNYINNMGITSPDMKNWQFPQEPRPDEEGWPYGEYTKGIMDPKNKGRKRGIGAAITCGKIKTYIFQAKPPFKQDLRIQPGGDAHGGLQQKMQGMDNDQSSSGSNINTRGRPGWSSAMGEFDLPNEVPDEETKENVDSSALNIEEPAPVGSPMPLLKFGGRADAGQSAGRKGFRRR